MSSGDLAPCVGSHAIIARRKGRWAAGRMCQGAHRGPLLIEDVLGLQAYMIRSDGESGYEVGEGSGDCRQREDIANPVARFDPVTQRLPHPATSHKLAGPELGPPKLFAELCSNPFLILQLTNLRFKVTTKHVTISKIAT